MTRASTRITRLWLSLLGRTFDMTGLKSFLHISDLILQEAEVLLPACFANPRGQGKQSRQCGHQESSWPHVRAFPLYLKYLSFICCKYLLRTNRYAGSSFLKFFRIRKSEYPTCFLMRNNSRHELLTIASMGHNQKNGDIFAVSATYICQKLSSMSRQRSRWNKLRYLGSSC